MQTALLASKSRFQLIFSSTHILKNNRGTKCIMKDLINVWYYSIIPIF